MLILFDIDGTILLTQGAGIKAMNDAGCELFGDHFTIEGVEFSGRLDVLIWSDLCQRNQVSLAPGAGDAAHERFRAAYGRHLHRRLHESATATLLPGVRALVEHLAAVDHVTLGLLTGNYPETGRLKIERAGLDPDLFAVAVWGIDGGSRRELPPVAMRRHHDRCGRMIASESVVIIGDTPHDIDCARHNGCRSIGVATGGFTLDDLKAAGADLAVQTLADTAMVLDWLGQGQATVAR